MKSLKLPLIGLLFFSLSSAWADSTPNVPVDDPVYRDLDKLVAARLVNDAIYGQRPWSRREIARMIAEATENRARIPTPLVPDDRELSYLIAMDDILEGLRSRFREELVDRGDMEGEAKAVRLHPLEEVRFDVTLLDGPFRDIPLQNGVGGLDAAVNPLVAHREGRHYAEGGTLGLETTHRAKLSRFFSFYARPRFEALVPTTGSADFNPLVQQLYGKFNAGKFELAAGRDSLVWGPGEFGGLLFSNNARPLDMVKLGNDVPFRHPWIFRYLGPSKYTLFVGNLGPEREFPRAFLYGFQVTFLPVSFFEIGFHHSILMGGEGAPGVRWYDPIAEFFFVRRGGVRGEGSQVADHRFGGHWRLRFPWLRRMDWYVELLWDDLGRESIAANFTEQMAVTTGIYFPLLTSDAGSDLRIEYSHIPPMLYRHSVFSSGYALNRLVLGAHEGPDSDRVSLTYRRDLSDAVDLKLQGAYFNFDNDVYDFTLSSQGAPDRLVKLVDRTTEHRIGLDTALTWQTTRKIRAQFDFGYEYIRNFEFRPREDAHHFRGGLTLTAGPLF